MPGKDPRHDTAADCKSKQADTTTALEHPSPGSGVNKENQQLEVGFKVLDKVKGHPYWQAKVTETMGIGIYGFFFFYSRFLSRNGIRHYGTGETNVIKHWSFIQSFTPQNILKLCANNKRKDLAVAL